VVVGKGFSTYCLTSRRPLSGSVQNLRVKRGSIASRAYDGISNYY
jgi:hypothetical protein